MITIRNATPADAAALLAIYTPYVLHTGITFESAPPTLADFRQRIATTLEHYPYLVAVDEHGEVAGYAYAHRWRERAAFAHCAEMSIYINKEKRRQGTGARLYAALEQRLKAQGISTLIATITWQDHPGQHITADSPAFHERMGYVKAGHLRRAGLKFGEWFDLLYYQKFI